MLEYKSGLKTGSQANARLGYQQCSVSVMDTIADPDISFDEKGICNYYYDYMEAERKMVFKGAEGESKLLELISKIKEAGKGKDYDCITGVSGGVDSTYLCLKAKEWGLRPLIVHFDNGWNSELSVKNIENIIDKLGFHLHTLVVDWDEFKDLQLAYLKASVVDIEVLTDHAIIGTMFKLAAKHNIKYILSGSNVVTEYVLPRHWIFGKGDHVNIRNIHKQFGTHTLKSYPFFDWTSKQLHGKIKNIQIVSPINYLAYNKKAVKSEIITKLNWRDYGGKHYESVFTRFYQGYILPVKFGIDKRKAHLSNLIFSGQITKNDAIEELKSPPLTAEQVQEDKEFVLKKLGLTTDEFDALMKLPRREHAEFGTEQGFYQKYPFMKPFRPIGNLLKKII